MNLYVQTVIVIALLLHFNYYIYTLPDNVWSDNKVIPSSLQRLTTANTSPAQIDH